MQFDAVEACVLGAQGGIGEQAGKNDGQFANVRQMRVGDALAVSEIERFEFGRREDAGQFLGAHGCELCPDVRIGKLCPQSRPMPRRDLEEALQRISADRAAAGSQGNR